FRWKNEVDSRSKNANRAAFAAQRALMGGGVNSTSAAADYRHSQIAELIGQFARRLDAVMRRHSRANYGYGIFVFRQQLALHVKDDRRIVNLAKQFGILLIILRDGMAAELRHALELGRQVNRFLPIRNGFRGIFADTFNPKKFVFGSFKN